MKTYPQPYPYHILHLLAVIILMACAQTSLHAKLIASLELGSSADNQSGVDHYTNLATKKIGDITGRISYVSATPSSTWGASLTAESNQVAFTLNRYAGQTSLVAWDFDLSSMQGLFGEYTLDFDYSGRRTGSGALPATIYISYNDAETGKALDTIDFSTLPNSSSANLSHIANAGYVEIGIIDNGSGHASIDLSSVLNDADDGKIRILLSEASYIGALKIASGGGITVDHTLTPNLVASLRLPSGVSKNEERFSNVATLDVGSIIGSMSYLGPFAGWASNMNGHDTSTTITQINRYAGQSSLIAYDYDLSPIIGSLNKPQLEFLYSGRSGFGDAMDIYVSYNDAETGKVLDIDDFSTLTPSSTDNAARPGNKGYVYLGTITAVTGKFSASLEDVIAQSDDAKIRILFVDTGYQSRITIEDGGIIIPQPGASFTDYFEEFVTEHNNNTPWNCSLPDFSYAGYHSGADPIPEVTSATHTVYDVTNYGAIADDGLSDHAAVVAALTAIHQSSTPAILQFPAGVYHLYQNASDTKLLISRNNVVIQGAGLGHTGTTLVNRYNGTINISPYSAEEPAPNWRGTSLSNVSDQALARRNSLKVKVVSPEKYTAGMTVILWATPTIQQEIDYYAPLPMPVSVTDPNSPVAATFTNYYWLKEIHQIESISGDELTLKEPIQVNLSEYGQAYFTAQSDKVGENMIEEVGIEGIQSILQTEQDYSHYRNTYGDHSFLVFNRAKNCWVRNIRASNYTELSLFSTSVACSQFNVILDGYSGHFISSINGSTGILTHGLRENTFDKVQHGAGCSAASAGNVFTHCQFFANFEAHQKFPHATLYDVCEGSFSSRGGGGNLRLPQHGKKLTFWNWRSTEPGTVIDYFDQSLQDNFGYILRPLVIGLYGSQPIFDRPTEELEIYDIAPVSPRSLYTGQLNHRLGNTPAWLTAANATFESARRYHRVELKYNGLKFTPADFTVGDTFDVTLEIPGDADLSAFTEIELLTTEGHYMSFDGGESVVGAPVLVQSFTKVGSAHTLTINMSNFAAGVHTLRARLKNNLGELTYSNPFVFIMRDPQFIPIQHPVASFERRDGGSTNVPYPLSATSYNKFHFDLGKSVPVDSLRFDWADSSGDAVVEIYTSNDASVWLLTDNDAAWDLGALYYTRSAIYPIPTRSARYIRVVVKGSSALNSIFIEQGGFVALP